MKEEKIEEQLSTQRNKLKEAKKKSRSGRWTTGKFANETSESSPERQLQVVDAIAGGGGGEEEPPEHVPTRRTRHRDSRR